MNSSVIVARYKKLFIKDDYVLDVGCGNGRNSIFLASLGCNVHSFDVVDLKWVIGLPKKLKKRIKFKKRAISKFKYQRNIYKAVIATRLIQYLSKKELRYFLSAVIKSLRSDGFFLLSYSAEGGIFQRKKIDVPKFSYPKKEIKEILNQKFKIVKITPGAAQSQSANYKSKIKSYDVFACKKVGYI